MQIGPLWCDLLPTFFSCRRCIRWLKVASLFVFVVVCSVSTTELCCWVSRAPGCLGLGGKAPKVWGSHLSLEEMLRARGLVGWGWWGRPILSNAPLVLQKPWRLGFALQKAVSFILRSNFPPESLPILFSTTWNKILYLSWACPAPWVAPRKCLAASICVVCILM